MRDRLSRFYLPEELKVKRLLYEHVADRRNFARYVEEKPEEWIGFLTAGSCEISALTDLPGRQ